MTAETLRLGEDGKQQGYESEGEPTHPVHSATRDMSGDKTTWLLKYSAAMGNIGRHAALSSGNMAEPIVDVRTELVALVPRLRRFAFALSGSLDEGEDLVQAACLKALDRLDQFTPGTRLDSWMFRIVQTTWIDRMRSRQRHAEVSDPDRIARTTDDGLSARRIEDRMLLERVRAAMWALPEDQRAALALVAIEGYSYKEAAEALDIPLGTVMSRLARARAKLLPLLKETA